MKSDPVRQIADGRGAPIRMTSRAILCCLGMLAGTLAVDRPIAGQSSESNSAVESPRQDAARGPITGDNDPRVKAAVARAVAYLKSRGDEGNVGVLALMVNALAKTHERFPDLIREDDATLARMTAALAAHSKSEFSPSVRGGPDNYEAGCAAMALAAIGRETYANELAVIARYILNKQLANGSWSYDGVAGGDTSMTQYALLGLWEASNAPGVTVPKQAWDKALQWLVMRQLPSGGFSYHPPDPGNLAGQTPTHTMTVASLGSMIICRDHLPLAPKKRNPDHVLLEVDEDKPKDDYQPQTTLAVVTAALARAHAWLEANFTIDRAKGEGDAGGGRWQLYYLYALERYGTLSDKKEIAEVNWYSRGAEHILSLQGANGSWNIGDGAEVSTSFAVLFLVKATKFIPTKPAKIPGGVLISGDNLNELIRDIHKVRIKTIRNSAGQIIDILIAGVGDVGDDWEPILKLDRVEAGAVPRPVKIGISSERLGVCRLALAKAIKEKDPITIKVALRCLAISGDLRMVPLMIDAMYYEDAGHDTVQLAARDSLCLMSRKFLGKYAGSGTTDWESEIERWKAWYKSVRPDADLDDELGGGP